MKFYLQDILKATNGELKLKNSSDNFTGISIDSRSLIKGDLFVAIKGAHFNGHDFISDALGKGAIGVVVDGNCKINKDVNIIKVANTTKALGDLAKWWKSRFSLSCIAITGSNGKSTTKEMVSSIISCKGPFLKTEGNYNNLIGLPLTIFRLNNEHRTAVLEMGMSEKGEIQRLTEICNPDVGVITNITAAHLEKLHSVEGVAHAKGELFETMHHRAIAIINDEDPWVKKIGEKYKGPKITFGMQNTSDVKFLNMQSIGLEDTDLSFSVKNREYKIKIPLPGTHNVMNALASIAVGVALNIEVENMVNIFSKFKPMSMRFERVQLSNGVCLINDSYNANPQSVNAAFRTVGAVKRSGRFIVVLGDMLELGQESAKLHCEVGELAFKENVDKIFVFGEYSSNVAKGARAQGVKEVKEYDNVESLSCDLEKEIKSGDVVLVKGSRGMKMERIVDYLKHNIGTG